MFKSKMTKSAKIKYIFIGWGDENIVMDMYVITMWITEYLLTKNTKSSCISQKC